MQFARKPLPLILSALWWTLQTVAAFSYATYVNFRIGTSIAEHSFGIGILAVLLFLTFSILWSLWSYWQGHDWTRTLLIIVLPLKVGYQLFNAYRSGHFSHNRLQVLFLIRLGDLLFNIYIFYWLLTKPAQHYFDFFHTDLPPSSRDAGAAP